ncbi:MAG: 16S rRNA (adenine(1518)-N(6)/adenine(1519)-N(6))-dimethyltransferase RsmA [Coxiellaceae bacterium]|nr:16S rRNA (adenine(1518)-N(6)/adenine(1519)-N(6))-dimethyltransferase RsmA [Coxiellaceae bacterium]
MNNTHTPRKRFGQHFLKDANVLNKMIREIGLKPDDHVVEIGPGQGALTDYLLQAVNHVNAVELDRDLVVFLREKYLPTQLTVHADDALRFNYATLSQKPRDLRIVGNLPYNISTPLLFHLFDYNHAICDMHFMLQKEVVLRLTAEVNTVDYGRLSIMSQYFCDNAYLFTVLPHSFNPPPKVDSAIVRLIPKTDLPLNANQFQHFSAIVKEAFNYRRKKLGNSLKRLVSVEQLAACDIDPELRPQEVSIDGYVRIAKSL